MTERTAYFDRLRVLACFFIIVIHISSYCWYDLGTESGSWLVLNAWKSIARFAVPAFIMISGALFLDRDVPLKTLFSKYILRLVVAYFFWNLVYALVFHSGEGLRAIFIQIVAGHYHMWFLPLMVGLYICIPLLKLIAKNETTLRYFLLIAFIFAFALPQILSMAESFGTAGVIELNRLFKASVFDNFNLQTCGGFAFYFMLGYYLSRTDFSKKARIVLYVLAAAGMVFTVLLTWADALCRGYASDTFHEPVNMHVALVAAGIFVLFKYSVKPAPSDRTFGRLSKWCFGVYLIHPLAAELLMKFAGIDALSFNPVYSVPVLSLGIFLLSSLISALINKIPFVNKYIV